MIFSNDAHYQSDPEVVRKWSAHAIKGTHGADVIPELQPKETDFIVEKEPTAAFTKLG